MCLILFALDAHPRYPLVLAANRDELHARPTRAAGWWEDAPTILAGRDLLGGGTWLGITRQGRWAAVTNFREPAAPRADAPSRGDLVRGFLMGDDPPERYLRHVAASGAEYNGFNLLVGDGASARWYSNRHHAAEPGRALGPGVYGLSNHLLDTPWPKVERGKRALARCLAHPEPAPEPLLEVLLDRTVAADHDLPDTDVGAELERALSTAFILGPRYGTRSSTSLLVDRGGEVHLVERTFRPATVDFQESRFRFVISPTPDGVREE